MNVTLDDVEEAPTSAPTERKPLGTYHKRTLAS